MILVTVKLYGMLRRHRPQSSPGAPHHPFTIEAPPGATVGTLLDLLSIPRELLQAAAVNNEAVDLETPLQPNDELSLFPPSAGGSRSLHP